MRTVNSQIPFIDSVNSYQSHRPISGTAKRDTAQLYKGTVFITSGRLLSSPKLWRTNNEDKQTPNKAQPKGKNTQN